MTQAIRKEVTVPLPPGAAFDLFTSGIDGWWPRRPRPGAAPRAALRLEPGRDGRLREEGPAPRTWARVTVWEPGRRLVLTWSEGHGEGEEPSEVEVRFTPVEAGTRVDVTHVALAPRPGAPWRRALLRYALSRASGWPWSPSEPVPSPPPGRGKVTASR